METKQITKQVTKQGTKIAVRLYNNPKFGKTFGKGMYYNAVFNGTLDLPQQHLKYLIDLVPFTQWQHTATTDIDMEALGMVIAHYQKINIDVQSANHGEHILCSWIKRFDSAMSKPKVMGFVTVDLRTCQLTVALVDDKHELVLSEHFPMRSCREKTGNSPDYFSSNYDADLKQRLAA
ncbi:hypothetical protein [Polynucleobacter sp. AP-Nino-20-G2]|uniref:hypothetical protein n=1 Tax=Polynucleobacter sp. AP-Nino-20-G2 TaxID=2576917 RepID=UPI001BFDBFC8|nr:hypothetical protein [Polynucleobacter sp. AP-Nino-20-G2]QWE16319.1 hypothetical protein FD960_08550 [Polynucleobacter sp. AP-Nino-20-G2]